jgi:hypothetical protein
VTIKKFSPFFKIEIAEFDNLLFKISTASMILSFFTANILTKKFNETSSPL